MSDRYRVYLIALGGLALASVAHAQPVNRHVGSDANINRSAREPDDQSRPSPRPVIESILARIAGALEISASQQETTEQRERAERDLTAQEGMAKWAGALFWTACVQIGLTFVGLLLIWRTLIHTRAAAHAARAAVEEAERATQAAVAGTEAMVQASEVNRIAYIADQRPWLSQSAGLADEGLTYNDRGARLTVGVRIKNHGRTPALRATMDAKMVILGPTGVQDIAQDTRKYMEEIRSRNAKSSSRGEVVFPGEEITPLNGVFIENSELDKAEESFDGEDFRPLNLVVVGCVTYGSHLYEEINQTPFVYIVARRSETGPMAILRAHGPLDVNKVGLAPYPTGIQAT